MKILRGSPSDPRRRTRRRRRVDQRGVALILVMGAITVLTVFLTQLQEETSSELAAALAERDARITQLETQLQMLLRFLSISGVDLPRGGF